jgi:hypothetical protein
MNITDRNVGKFNKEIQSVANDINVKVNLPKKDPKEIRQINKVPQQKTISFKKMIPYDEEYATKGNKVGRSSYYDDLVNSLNLKTKSIKEDTHTLLTSTVSEVNDTDTRRIIQKVNPKNQVSGITDKNLMSHIIVPSSLAQPIVPKNEIKPMGVYRKADSTPLPPIVTPVTSSKEKMITIK